MVNNNKISDRCAYEFTQPVGMPLDWCDAEPIMQHYHTSAGADPSSSVVLNFNPFVPIIALAERLHVARGAPLHLVDVGGGVGIPYFLGETPFYVTALTQKLNPVSQR